MLSLHNNTIIQKKTAIMLHIENRINIIMGGYRSHNESENNRHIEIDNFFKLFYIETGTLRLKDNKNSYNLKTGELYIVNGYKISNYDFSECSLFWVDFTPQSTLIDQALYQQPSVVTISQETLLLATKYSLFDGDFTELITTNHNPLKAIKLGHLINGAIIDVLDNYTWDESCENTAIYNKINIAVQYIEDNFNKNIPIDSLAQMCNLSLNHFHRLFVTATRLTPVNYITKRRMNEALTLISTCHNIKEVAYLLGYCNDAYFSRTFHKTFGFTPGEFKKNLASKQK